MLIFLNCVSLCALALATYFIWWDRKNVFNHFFIGFCIVGYIIPSLVINFTEYATPDIIQLYVIINLVGTCTYIVGLLTGNKIKSVPIINTVMHFAIPQNINVNSLIRSRILKICKYIYITSLIVMALCFVFMGYLPMFAADPYAAKQFKGVYQGSYQKVAFFYRTAKQYIELLMPFLLVDYFVNRKNLMLLLILLGLILITVTLNRSAMFKGIVWIVSIVISLRKSKKFFLTYLVFLVLIFSIGSSFWSIISYFFPNSAYISYSKDQTVGQAIAMGSPDITDQLQLLGAFVKSKADYTYGLTFVGGLIPFNFPWNPAVWTLSILNDTNDISEISSGGLRLPVTMWGYVSFGWLGVILVPFLSGFFQGYIIKRIRRIVDMLKPNIEGYFTFYFIVFLYLNIGTIFIDFYELSIYYFPAYIFLGIVIHISNKELRKMKFSNLNYI